jgi:hypothetical protein
LSEEPTFLKDISWLCGIEGKHLPKKFEKTGKLSDMKFNNIVTAATSVGASLLLLTSTVAARPIRQSCKHSVFNHRIALTDDNHIVMSWESDQEAPVVKYGQSKETLLLESRGSALREGDEKSIFANVVELDSLRPGIIYYYTLGESEQNIHSFVAPPEDGDDSPFSFALVNELGCTRAAMADGVMPSEEEGILHSPVLSTVDSLDHNKYDFEFIWQLKGPDSESLEQCKFTHAQQHSLEHVTSSRAFMNVRHRNHPWYSFNYGLAHLIQLAADVDSHDMHRQVKWLRHDLRKVQRALTPWVIISSQRSQELEKVIDEFKVDVIFSDDVDDELDNQNQFRPTFIANGLSDFESGDTPEGWGKVTVFNATHMLYEYISSSDDFVVSSIAVSREHATSMVLVARDAVEEPSPIQDIDLEASFTSITTPLTTLQLLTHSIGEENVSGGGIVQIAVVPTVDESAVESLVDPAPSGTALGDSVRIQ